MRILKKKVGVSNFNIFLFGDAHLGTALHSKDGFESFLDAVQPEIVLSLSVERPCPWFS